MVEIGPDIHLHAFSPDEVSHAALTGNVSGLEVLRRLKAAGLGSLQGTAAEILVDSVRKVISPRKLDAVDRVRIITDAHPWIFGQLQQSCTDPMKLQEIKQNIWEFSV